MVARVKIDLCVGCEMCVEICKEGAIKMNGDFPTIDTEKCTSDGLCVDECPTDAIELE